jgi:hypothetical protein
MYPGSRLKAGKYKGVAGKYKGVAGKYKGVAGKYKGVAGKYKGVAGKQLANQDRPVSRSLNVEMGSDSLLNSTPPQLPSKQNQ